MFKNEIWENLEELACDVQRDGTRMLYNNVPNRNALFKQVACGIELDFSKQRITKKVLALLCDLAESSQLKDQIDALMSGDKVNASEDRPALHTALRVPVYKPFWVNGCDVLFNVFETREQMEDVAIRVRQHNWLGYSGKHITDVVNVGMGGSDLGAKFCLNALKDDVTEALRFHFISDGDPDSFESTVATLSPEKTLFIVSSKSFTTQETLFNTKQAMCWIGDAGRFDQHFIAVTAHTKKANALGIKKVLSIWDWVGGRYSACSAVNLVTMIAIGPEKFKMFLSGAHEMDLHYQNTPFEANIPVLAALLGIWNNNFLGIHTLLMLVYSRRLEQFVPYVQQLDMESNGKRINRENKVVSYATAPIVWGGHGNRAQHSYYQLLCQGTHRVAIDFISIKTFDNCIVNAVCRAKQKVLANGVDAGDELSKQISGETPFNHFRLERCSPYTIGSLIALYEHKIHAQGVVWNINSFDQPGVESAKERECNSV